MADARERPDLKLGAQAVAIPWVSAAYVAACLHQIPAHPVLAGFFVSIAVLLFLAGMAAICAWIWLYKEYRDRKPKIRRWDLERDIRSLEVDLGIGLGEDWWRP